MVVSKTSKSVCVGLICAFAVLCVGTAWAAGPNTGLSEGRNFDARIEHNRNFVPTKSASQNPALEALRAEVPNLGVTFDETMGVTRSILSYSGFLTDRPTKAGADPMDIALDYVRANFRALGLTANDIAEFEVTDRVDNAITGSTHIYLRQQYKGLPVYNGQLQINLDSEGRILGVNNAFVPRIASAVRGIRPALAARESVGSAILHLGMGAGMPAVLRQENDTRLTTVLSGEGISLEDITAQLILLPVRAGEVSLTWNFRIQTLDSQHYFDFTIDAETGEVMTRFDWTNSSDFNVYKEPDESPLHGTTGRQVVFNPEDATASPNGWFTGGTMSGNNVTACPDTSPANNSCDSNPQCSGTSCNFSINLNNAPSTYVGAATTNLFYWNNLIHDVQYQYGFTESAGNFQENNFGRGGSGSDSVNADAQDGSGNCNANFSTPTDGGNPRMQMFTCTNASPTRDGDLDNAVIVHEYGHGISIRQVGGPGNSSCLNNSQQAGEGWSDWHGLVYTAETGDAGTDSRGIGTYLFGQGPNDGGIRDLPYSTNQSINNWTYESIRTAGVPHGVGSRWAQAIWEVYWALVADHGFSAGDQLINPSTPMTGSQRALLYVNEGLQNTACSPTFLDNRDGVIQAVTANFGGEDLCTVWTAFAAFGLGENATTTGSNSSATNGFNVPAGVCGGPPPPPPPPSECPAGSVDLTGMVSYSNQNASNGMSNPDNETITLTGNTWKRTTQTFNITADTMVEFTFSSTDQGEIHAIGFDADDTLNDEPAHCQFWGTQNWTGTGNIGNDACGPGYSGSGTQTFTYPIGQFITGTRFLVLTNDDDAAASANGTFSCVRVFEDGGPPPPPPGGCTVDDDFETNTDNWIISGASTCTTGTYVDGNPTQQTSTVVTQPAGSASGVHSIFTATNSTAGNADVDGGNCIVETIDPYVVAVPSTLSISYFHGQRDTGDDASGDFFNVQWSSNGGATWNNVVSNGDTRSVAAWATATAQVPAGNIDVRVQCSDGAGPGDIVECGIDDLSICDN